MVLTRSQRFRHCLYIHAVLVWALKDCAVGVHTVSLENESGSKVESQCISGVYDKKEDGHPDGLYRGCLEVKSV